MLTSQTQSLYGPDPLDAHMPLARNGSLLLRAGVRRVLHGRQPIAWSLALLFLFKGTICLAAVLFPVSPKEPTGVVAIAGAIALVCACGVWLLAARIPTWGFALLAAAGALTTSALVSRATTHGGMMIAAFSYPWIAIYSAHFFARRIVIAQASLISIGFGAALLLGGLPGVGIYWLIVAVTIWSICLLLGRLSESLRHQADTDPLTGLLNRNGFLTAATREHAIARRGGNRLTLAVLDLDGFKQINDLRGHAVGDRLLSELGRSWVERLRAGDILARHGGDEFVLLLPATTPEGAARVIERLHVEGLPVTWSTGIGEWLADESLGDCIARADAQLYSVKHALRLRDTRARVEPLLHAH